MTDKGVTLGSPNVEGGTSPYDIEDMSNELREYGLTVNETKVFLQLSRFSPNTASEMGRLLGIPRTEVYNIVASLQNKGIIEATLDRPAKFYSIPIRRALDTLIEAERNRISTMESKREEVLKRWEAVYPAIPPEEKERLQLLRGTDQIYARLSDLIAMAQNEVDMVAFGTDLTRALDAGILRKARDLHNKGVAIRLLTDVKPKALEAELSHSSWIDIRQTESAIESAPHFVVVDGHELLMFTKLPGGSRTARKKATAMWTNSLTLVQTMKRLFDETVKTPTAVARLVAAQVREPKTPSEEQVAFRKQMMREFSMLGLEAVENMKIVGRSGITHEFDLGVVMGSAKPTVVDFVFDATDVSVVPVIRFFAKQSDVAPIVDTLTLVVSPRLATDAKELAKSYGIRITELHR
jgi:sugar-specific transcriptional regulator TrmB